MWRLSPSVYATEKRSCLSCLRRRLFVRVQGIALFATALPYSLLPDRVFPSSSVTPRVLRMGVVSRTADGAPVCGRSVAPLPSSLHTYYTTKEGICQYLFQNFFDRLRRSTSKSYRWEKGVAALFINSFRHNRYDKGCQPSLHDCRKGRRNRNPCSKRR